MVINELREDLTIEFARMDETLKEIRQILNNYKNGTLTRSDVVAGATYLAQCYGGIENILKRIIRYAGLPLPSGPFWHAEIESVLKRFVKNLGGRMPARWASHGIWNLRECF